MTSLEVRPSNSCKISQEYSIFSISVPWSKYISDVSKAFADKKILDHANFTIKDQEFFVLVGPSGSGKTTTLKMINQLVTQSEGKILINNEEISTANLRKLRLSVGYVLQQIALFPNLTVSENIA